MSDDDAIGFYPTRTERRGKFPRHHDDPPPEHGPYTAEQALRRALDRLHRWKAEHDG